jgi:hypothetical protein
VRATEIGPATFRPQQRGLEHDLADLNRLVGKRSSRVAEKGEIEDPDHQHIGRSIRRAGLVSAESPISSRQLDQLPADQERAAGRAGVTWATPRREGLQVLAWEGCAGALRFVFQGAIVPFPGGALCRSSREAPSGLRDAPAGPRVVCGAGERAGAPPRSTRRGFPCSVLR